MAARQPAPPPMHLVEDFVNTRNEDDESLATPAALAGWLTERGLGPPRLRATKDDLARAVEVREALRALLMANNGGPADPDAPRALNAFAARVPYVARFSDGGAAALSPAGDGADSALAGLLRIVLDAMAEGTWPRLKACRMRTCGWAFYDSSKNRSAAWCSMRVCGNRQKARTYRARHGG